MSHDHDHPHHHRDGWWRRVVHAVRPHSHDTADHVDSELESSREGTRAVWISLAVLGTTAVLQAVVVVWSGSVALLGDTLHNVADALTALPLAIAFALGRRAPKTWPAS
jgi:Co/Zn/Cd efflux system component